MALTTIDFKATFDVVNHKITVTDITNYAGQSVALSAVTGAVSIEDPNGNSYSGSIDQDVSLSTTAITIVPISGGSFVPGTYSIVYVVTVTATSDTVTKTLTFEYDFNSPTVSLELTVNCIQPLLTSTDTTNYTVDGINPTITRAHKIEYPQTTGHADITGTGAVLETDVMYTQANQPLQHSSTLVSTLLYNFGNGFFISDVISGNAYADVTCDNSLCEAYCCLKSQYTRWQNAKCENSKLAETYKNEFILMRSIADQLRNALECGKEDDVSGYLTELKRIGNCTGDCGCSGDEPELVTGLGGGGSTTQQNYFVVGTTDEIIVNTVTSGLNTTSTVSIDPNYTAAITVSDALSFDVVIDSGGSGVLPTITLDNVSLNGTYFLDTVSIENENDTSASVWENNNISFVLSDYVTTVASKDYQIFAKVVLLNEYDPFGTSTQDTIQLNLNVWVQRDQDDVNTRFGFAFESGAILTGDSLINFIDKIKVSFLLKA